jgi:hypothetical protein
MRFLMAPVSKASCGESNVMTIAAMTVPRATFSHKGEKKEG